MASTTSTAPPDAVTTAEKGVGFFARHWTLVVFIGLAVLLSPALVAIIQVIVGVARGIGDFGKVLAGFFGPIGSWTSQMSQKCADHPTSWDCWLLYIGVGMLPIFGGLIKAWRAGKFSKTVDNIAANNNTPVDAAARDSCDRTRAAYDAAASKLPPADKENPKVRAYLEALVAGREVKRQLEASQLASQLEQAAKDQQNRQLIQESADAVAAAKDACSEAERDAAETAAKE